MIFNLKIAPIAEDAILDQARFIAADNPIAAIRWYQSLFDTILTLRENPKRHPVAEMMSVVLGLEVRKLVIGNYLIFYHVDDNDLIVSVVRFRHAARRPLL